MANLQLHSLPHKPHAVVFPFPVQGQINPMIRLANILISRGFIISFVNTKHNHMRMLEARSQQDFPSCEQDDVRFVWIPAALPMDIDHSNIRARSHEFHTAICNMRSPFEELLENLNEKFPPVTCIIFGTYFPWTHDVASKFNIPTVFFWTQSAAVFSIYHHMPTLTANGFFPFKTSGDTIAYIPGIPPLHSTDFPSPLHVEDASDTALQTMTRQIEGVGESDWVFINSYYDLEKEVFDALQKHASRLIHSIHPVGPLLPSAFLDGRGMKDASIGASLLKEQSESIQWLDEHPTCSVLFVSFGSLFRPSLEQLQEIAFGLKASQQRFLWALRPDSTMKNVSEILPVNFLEDTKEQGLVIRWAPQLQVLSHPSVGGFLSHCGWNSTLESITMGVPIMPFPIFGDQGTNARYVADVWKVGLDFIRQDDGMVKSEEVERVVRIVMQEEEGRQLRCRAAKLRDVARRARQDGGSSDIHIQQFVEAMKQRVQQQVTAIL